MIKFLFGVLVGILLCFLFLYFGGWKDCKEGRREPGRYREEDGGYGGNDSKGKGRPMDGG